MKKSIREDQYRDIERYFDQKIKDGNEEYKEPLRQLRKDPTIAKMRLRQDADRYRTSPNRIDMAKRTLLIEWANSLP